MHELGHQTMPMTGSLDRFGYLLQVELGISNSILGIFFSKMDHGVS